MDDSRFDTWTRRRVGLTVGGLTASLLGAKVAGGADARRKKPKKTCAKVRCTQPLALCDPSIEDERCCPGRNCDLFGIQPGLRCCLALRSRCTAANNECCRSHACAAVSGLAGNRCCASLDEACLAADDCCGDAICGQGSCRIPPGP
jgi:hypothetical protein